MSNNKRIFYYAKLAFIKNNFQNTSVDKYLVDFQSSLMFLNQNKIKIKLLNTLN